MHLSEHVGAVTMLYPPYLQGGRGDIGVRRQLGTRLGECDRGGGVRGLGCVGACEYGSRVRG